MANKKLKAEVRVNNEDQAIPTDILVVLTPAQAAKVLESITDGWTLQVNLKTNGHVAQENPAAYAQ